jgi:hypothetical protein
VCRCIAGGWLRVGASNEAGEEVRGWLRVGFPMRQERRLGEQLPPLS